MKVKVTEHAVERYRQRTMRVDMADNEVTGNLIAAALRGKQVAKRAGNAWEVEYQKLTVIVIYEKDLIIVVSCLGDKKYRRWIQRQEKPRYQKRAG